MSIIKKVKIFIPLILLPIFSVAGEVSGIVTDEQGNPLQWVKVCLQITSELEDCQKVRFTNEQGQYGFKGLKAKETYHVRIITEASLKARKENLYPNYIWSPLHYTLNLPSKSDKMIQFDFTGVFNFSNFQAEIQLTYNDFSLLQGYDLNNDYVFLKVYTVDAQSGDQELIYLGQVSDSQSVLIEASIPLVKQQIFYEVYSFNYPQPQLAGINLRD